jgi:hypothetical protein
MLVSGDYIEMTIGVTMGISTMAAAALGNVIADVLGLNLGGLIEEISYKVRVWVCLWRPVLSLVSCVSLLRSWRGSMVYKTGALH